eukprot:scaffold551_cov395-Prasinococcus_capsulatus_cf.AAC.11
MRARYRYNLEALFVAANDHTLQKLCRHIRVVLLPLERMGASGMLQQGDPSRSAPFASVILAGALVARSSFMIAFATRSHADSHTVGMFNLVITTPTRLAYVLSKRRRALLLCKLSVPDLSVAKSVLVRSYVLLACVTVPNGSCWNAFA